MATTSGLRDYRKGNWTVEETMVLIQGKNILDEMRRKEMSSEKGKKPSELRWKWIENYCWGNGCYRSQNQCNDKWDNLMRDFKKVREYERGVSQEADKSYWKIEKNERRDKNLPTSMLRQIYDALVDVVETKDATNLVVGSTSAGGGGSSAVTERYVGFSQPSMPPPPPLPPPPMQHHPAPARILAEQPTLHPSQPLPTGDLCASSDSDTSEHSDSPAKRMRGAGGGTSGAGSSGGDLQEVSTAISESASMIAQAIRSSEERGERRHRELLNSHERRLQIEESKAEINRDCINGMLDAVNKLSNSILDLATRK